MKLEAEVERWRVLRETCTVADREREAITKGYVKKHRTGKHCKASALGSLLSVMSPSFFFVIGGPVLLWVLNALWMSVLLPHVGCCFLFNEVAGL